MNTVVEKRVYARGAGGKFAKKTKAPKVEAVKETIVAKAPVELDMRGILLFDRRSGSTKTGKALYLKVINPTIPACKDNYYYRVADAQKLTITSLHLKTISDYGNYFYCRYTGNDGITKSTYIPSDYKMEVVDEGCAEYTALAETFEKVQVLGIHQQLNHQFTIGCDPEIFAVDEDKKMIPAFKFLPGKDKPAYTHDVAYGNCPMYWDGFQAEFTTQANHCLGYHGDSIAAGMRGVYDAVRKYDKKATLSNRSVFYIEPEVLATAEDEHVAFGCMPSFNLYGLKVDMPPAREVPFRSAGGHIHFGVGKITNAQAEPMVRALDAILGVACVSLFAEFDNPVRRILYGLPGEYRLPPHGLEYRPLSNAWLCHPMIMNLVIDLSRKCVVFGRDEHFKTFWNATQEETIDCIIKCDVEASHRILERNKVVFKQLLKASHQQASDDSIENLYDTFIKGIRSAIKDPDDFVKNWKLRTGWVPHSGRMGEPNVATFIRGRLKDPEFKM